MKKYLNLN